MSLAVLLPAMLLPALAMGFFGSPHCMGMCGGIVTAFGISIKDLSPQKRAMLIGSYHVGRLGSYMFLGLIATLFGEHILAPFLTNNAMPRILVGLAIIFASLLMLGVPFLNKLEKMGLGLWNALAPIRQKVLPMNSVPKALAAGLLWGFLPCGLVYGALGVAVGASAGSDIAGFGVLFMLMFGIGTLPMLVLTGSALSWLQTKVKAFNLRKFSGAVMLVSGLLIAFSPVAMKMMHGGHGSHGTHTDAHTMPQNDTMHSQPMPMHDHANHTDHAHHGHSH